MVECVEQQVNNFSNVIKNLDKKMSYNLRLLSNMIYKTEKDNIEDKIYKKLSSKTLKYKQDKIVP